MTDTNEVRPGLVNPSPRDWPEDFPHENGNYWNTCCHCNRQFVGHKRRPACKECVVTGRLLERVRWEGVHRAFGLPGEPAYRIDLREDR